MEEASNPAPVSSQDMIELEFHISPVFASSRPQVSIGTSGTIESRYRASSRLLLSRLGLSTASLRSGMAPFRHRLSSYRNMRQRPAQAAPTGPSATTPRSAPLASV